VCKALTHTRLTKEGSQLQKEILIIYFWLVVLMASKTGSVDRKAWNIFKISAGGQHEPTMRSALKSQLFGTTMTQKYRLSNTD
jgi:hypothetical protein